MTRYRLYRLAVISASFLGCAVLGAGMRALGLHTTLKVVAFCALGGAAVSAGWHGIRSAHLRYEEHLQAKRRHRAPRPDRMATRPPSAPAGPPADAADAWPDPYAPDTDPAAQAAPRYYVNDEIHVHRTSSPV